MNTFFRNALAALVVVTAGIAASAPAANAGGIGFELSIGGPAGGLVVSDHRRHGGWDRGHGRHGGWDRGYDRRSVCRPHHAVEKARHMGVRRAYVEHVSHRRVVVEGFRHHRPVRVAFANERHCPVIGFRR